MKVIPVAIVLRSLLFDGVFYLGTLFSGIFFSSLFMFSRVLIVRFSSAWSKNALWLMEKILRLTYKIEGVENIPSGSFIVASKHQSAWETIAFPSFFKDPAFVLKKSLLFIPFFGWALRKLDMLAVERRQGKGMGQFVRKARKITAEGRPLIVFPEGTRTLPGQTAPYKRGLWVLYRQLGLPIVPVALNSGVFWKRRTWIKKPGSISVIFGQPLPPGLRDEKQFFLWIEENIEIPSQRLLRPPCSEN